MKSRWNPKMGKKLFMRDVRENMMTRGSFVLALLLTGCGGSPFDAPAFTETDSGGVVAPAADADGTGGGASLGTGGATPGTGGAIGAGGSMEEDGGVVEGSGGALGTGGGVVAADACAPVTHDNGLGQTWQDCVALGTYTQVQAMKACAASGAGMCLALNGCGGINWEVRGYTTDGSQVLGFWMYGGSGTGLVAPGASGSPPCSGPTAFTHQWE